MSHDYIMRQIEDMVRFLATTLFQKEPAGPLIFNEYGEFSSEQFLLYQLEKLVLQKQINQAENLLFQQLEETPTKEYFAVALQFYQLLQQMTDSALEECNFSRQEIMEGLRDIEKLCNLSNNAPTE